MSRISREELFIRMAELMAERGTCPRGKVGAVIVRDRRVISTGYNGAPPGMAHCTDEDIGCEILPMEVMASITAEAKQMKLESLGCQRTVHAEANAIAHAARHGISVEGATMYCTHSPCRKCAQLMASAGIVRLVWKKPYRLTPWDSMEPLKIEMVQCG